MLETKNIKAFNSKDNYFTPLDYIAGQTEDEFHEELEKREMDDKEK